LNLVLFNRLHFVGDLGRDLSLADQRAVDLLDRLRLLRRVLDLDEAESSRRSERLGISWLSKTSNDLGRFDADGEVGEDGRERIVIDLKGKVGNKDGVLLVSLHEQVRSVKLTGLGLSVRASFR
jgi:hypothetical protein